MLLREISSRRAVRSYKPDPVSDDVIRDIVKAGEFAPSAHGNRSIHWVVVREQAMKDKMYEVTGADQDFVKEAPVILIPVIDPKKTVAPIQDLSVATENVFLQAAAFGLGTVWKNLREEQAAALRTLLGVPEGFLIINLIPIGVPSEAILPHEDADFQESKIHRGAW